MSPGSVANAAPVTVLPLSLCKSFSHARAYEVDQNEYLNGEYQGKALTATSRKRWKLSKRITSTELGTLRTFYFARSGPKEPFYFYDPWASGFTYDATGVQTTGRYTVRFDSNWNQVSLMGRMETELSLVELA
jgi:hypothetical protein